MNKHNFFYRNSLSIVLFIVMFICLYGQIMTAWKTENKELAEEGQHLLSSGEYLYSGHFVQATFENWEIEFLQMMLYFVLTVFLRKKRSSELKSLDEKEYVDEEPRAHSNAPWPVK